MKVLLVSPNIESLPDPVFPLGLASIAAALKTHGIDYSILDLCFADDYDRAIVSALHDCRPDIVGLSLRNIDNVSWPNYVTYLPFCRRVIETIREASNARVVVGGSAFALMPQPLLQYLGADFGVIGEGEAAFVKLIEDVDDSPLHTECGPSRIVGTHCDMIGDLDALPCADRSKFDNEAYLKWGGMGNIQTKRGCPFQCIYCTYPIIEGRNVRVRSPERVCDEIEGLLNSGVGNLFFVDNTFNYPMVHAKAVCREIRSRNLPVKWSCYANPKFVTPALITLMQEAGCSSVEFGSDAAENCMLENLGKNFTVDDLKAASAVCEKAGMAFCHSLIIGGPGETMESVRSTFQAIDDMAPTAAICMIGIRMFPGTRLAAIALDEGVIGNDVDFLEPVFYLSSAIEDEILSFAETFAKDHPTWIFPGMNINMTTDLQHKLRRFGSKGPLWEYMKRGQKIKRTQVWGTGKRCVVPVGR